MTIESLKTLLTLTPGEGTDTFLGEAEAYGVIGIYGGHLLGQALAAGFQTVDEPKLANSFHAYFLRPGNPALPLIYHVNRIRDGRGFDTRLISTHGDVTIFTMLASFKTAEPDQGHHKTMPDVPAAATVVERREAAGIEPSRFPMVAGGRVQMELISEPFVPSQFSAGRSPNLRSWMRVPAGQVDPRMTQCMLAYLSDGTLMFNAVLPYGIPFKTHRLTSLDQSVWFHHHCDISDWMLYDQRCPVVADSRGLNEGEVFDSSGNHILSASQESMLRRMGR